ncbi:MAG TPA: hypothetical protein PKO18_00910 [Chitinophagales bacterium]|jgi:hypothetical protein|nr:hypothetical protein [Chitinophagales bacterium]HNL83763.1 hypothetical protein [Chitinophagales bacterium]
MKKKLYSTLLCTLAIIGLLFNTHAKPTKKAISSPVIGSWKHYNSAMLTKNNLGYKSRPELNYSKEEFTFYDNATFKHDFINEDGILIKSLKGKWSATNNKIDLVYDNLAYNLSTNYFFIGDELVIGQAFNHIILQKEDKQSQYAENNKSN